MKAARIEGYEPVEIVAHDMLAPVNNHASLRLSVTNVLNRPVFGTLTATLGALTLAEPNQTKSFLANETKELSLSITGGEPAEDNTYPLTVTFDAGKDGSATHAENMHVNFIVHRTINVDGNLDDWKGVPPQPMHADANNPAQAAVKAWLPFMKFDEKVGNGVASVFSAYDDQNFYFAARIADNTPDPGGIRYAARNDDEYFYPETYYHINRDGNGKEIARETFHWPPGVRRFSYRKEPAIPSNIGSDSVQIGFGIFPPGKNGLRSYPDGTMPRYTAYKSIDYEFALNSVADKYGGGAEMWRLLALGMPYKHFYPRQPKAPVDGGPVSGAKLIMRRDGNERIVEASMPWSEIPGVREELDAGRTIKFAARVNDNNGPWYNLAANRSVSKTGQYSFHPLWVADWSNELEFAFEK